MFWQGARGPEGVDHGPETGAADAPRPPEEASGAGGSRQPAGPPSIFTPPPAPSVPGQPDLAPGVLRTQPPGTYAPGGYPGGPYPPAVLPPGAYPPWSYPARTWPGLPAQPGRPAGPYGPGAPLSPGGPGRTASPGRGQRRAEATNAEVGTGPVGQAVAAEAVEKLGSTEVARPKSNIHTLTIIGQIEGHIILPSQNKTTKYEHILPQLVAVEMNPDIEGLLVILNTVGGDVEAGLALAELLSTMSKPTVSLILGGGHSIGIPVAVAADHSFIAPTATMTIHPIRLSGLVIGVPQTYEYLDKMQDRVVRFIVENSRISEGHLRGLMFRTGELARDIGTVLVGEEAVAEGLIDEVGGVARALAKLHELIAVRPPKGARPA